uniref:Uncharacterized protein n=1 Tax=Zea mays TaxID=4577 RepID=A0A804N2D2_MAIZE
MLPYLDLAERLASRGHRVTFVSTPRNIARFPSVRTQAGAVDRVSYSAWWRFRCHTSTACRMLPSPPTMSLTTRWSSSGRPSTGSQRPSRSSSAPPLTRAAGDRTDASSSISSTTGPPPLPASTRFAPHIASLDGTAGGGSTPARQRKKVGVQVPRDEKDRSWFSRDAIASAVRLFMTEVESRKVFVEIAKKLQTIVSDRE